MRSKYLLHSEAIGRNAAKFRCLACEQSGVPMNREHFWPEWLSRRANVRSVRWLPDKRIHPKSATIPLCVRCNSDLGEQLELPVSRVFDEVERGEGLSSTAADLLVRWMWKFEGFSWQLADEIRTYSHISTLRDVVLNRLGTIKHEICLAISIIDKIDPSFGDSPIGIDSENRVNRIFVSGVFCRLAIVVLLSRFASTLPAAFSVYRFPIVADDKLENAKLFYPKIGFATDIDAVGVTRSISPSLADLHDKLQLRDRKRRRI